MENHVQIIVSFIQNQQIITQCKTCNVGYYVNENFTCSLCSTSCIFGCVGRNDFCLNPYDYHEIEGCLEFSDSGTTCIRCDEDKYQLNEDGICVETYKVSCKKHKNGFEDDDSFDNCVLCFDYIKNLYFEPKLGDCLQGPKESSSISLSLLFMSFILFFLFI